MRARHVIVLRVESGSKLPWKTEPPKKIAATPPSRPQLDVKRLTLAAGVAAVGAALAMWAIAVTFEPGAVLELERAPALAPYPLAPEAILEAERRAAEQPVKPKQSDAPAAVPRNAEPAFGADVPSHAQQGLPTQLSSAPATPRTATPPRTAPIPPPSLRFETFEEVKDSSVYSARDADVAPPVAIYPQQLGRMPLGVAPEDLAMIEVLINTDGTVAEVRAKESPQSLDDAMMITMSMSAAKTWRFQPAQKEGRPVRYRQILPVSLR